MNDVMLECDDAEALLVVLAYEDVVKQLVMTYDEMKKERPGVVFAVRKDAVPDHGPLSKWKEVLAATPETLELFERFVKRTGDGATILQATLVVELMPEL